MQSVEISGLKEIQKKLEGYPEAMKKARSEFFEEAGREMLSTVRRRIGGHQHQNVFAASRMRHRSRRGARETVGSATQGNFAQRRQIRSREKVRKRRPDPLGRVDFARAQALDEVSRLQIDDFDRIGRVENAVGDPLGGRHSCH